MSARGVVGLALAFAACNGAAPCPDRTLRASLTFPLRALSADTIAVEVVLPGRDLHATQPIRLNSLSGTLDLALDAAYVVGQTATVRIAALAGTTELASGSKDVPLGSGCGTFELALIADDVSDAAMPRDDAADLASGTTDLAAATDLAGTCVDTSTRCNDNTLEVCQSGAWTTQTACTYFCSGNQCVTPPSCSALASNCGAAANLPCCTSPKVPGLTYDRSYDGVDTGYTDPSFVATVSSFRLDRFEVTVARFRAFVASGYGTQAMPPAAGAAANPAIAGSGWDLSWNTNLSLDTASLKAALKCDSTFQTWRDSIGTPAAEDLPINCVTWYDAFAFCAWDGGRLPTEAEWNATAAGGSQQRPYPFGASVDPSYAVYDCTGDGSAAGNCAYTDIQIVGSRTTTGDGVWGHSDLAGNMQEFVLDYAALYALPCNDCADITLGSDTRRVIRGGGFSSLSTEILASARAVVQPGVRGNSFGFRCARAP